LPRDIAGLKARIIVAVKNIDAPMWTRVSQELEYRNDRCRVTVVHISNISSRQKKKKKKFFFFFGSIFKKKKKKKKKKTLAAPGKADYPSIIKLWPMVEH